MATFESSSLSTILKRIEQDVIKVLKKEVAYTAQDELIMALDETIYNPYLPEPEEYNRRKWNNGGLGDRKEMDVKVDGTTLILTDDAKPANDWDMNLDKAIVEGYSNQEYWWNKPRDFYKVARENLEKNHSATEAMAEGLTKLGYKVVKG